MKRAASRPAVAAWTMLVSCFVALLLLASMPPRAEASGEPVPTVSRYMSTLDSRTLYREGCAMGNKTGIVVLDFGLPSYAHGSWGTRTFGNFFASTKAIKNAAKSYLQGYWYCTSKSAPYLRLALGTSNYGNHVGSGQGQAWAKMVNDLNCWVRSKGWDVQEGVRGATTWSPRGTLPTPHAGGCEPTAKPQPASLTTTITAPPTAAPRTGIAPTAGLGRTYGTSPGAPGGHIRRRRSTTMPTSGNGT
jgi:hypothetical protein